MPIILPPITRRQFIKGSLALGGTAMVTSRALATAASCACFGKVEVSPWYTLILDVWALAALLVFPPGREAWLSRDGGT